MAFEVNDQIRENNTTAIYPNRINDKNKVEEELGFPEFLSNKTKIYLKNGDLFSSNYNRIVYGDHGPYMEFNKEQIEVELFSKFAQSPPSYCYYEWMFPKGNPSVKVYRQLKNVKYLKNPPKDGFQGNRAEGYADYIPGFYYVSPYDFKPFEKKNQ